MNALFAAVFFISAFALAIFSPQNFLPALLSGGERAAKLCLTLFCIYAAWMGLSNLAEKSGLSKKGARLLTPLTFKLFKTKNERAAENISMNLACNLLGLGGAATPFAVKAIGELEKEKNSFAQKLLFIINATSVQIVPTTVIALRTAAGSAAAADIFLPSFVCTVFSTGFAVLLFTLRSKKWRI